MKFVLKTHVLMVLTLALPLQLHGMNLQALRNLYRLKNLEILPNIPKLPPRDFSFIFGATAGAAGVLLAYAGYKAWKKEKEKQFKPDTRLTTLKEIVQEINKDTTKFIQLLYTFNQADLYQNIYKPGTQIYNDFKSFLQQYRTGLITARTVEDLPRVKYFMRQLNQLHSIDEKLLTPLKHAILDIAQLIHDFIENHVDKEPNRWQTFLSYVFRKKMTEPSPIPDEKIESIIETLIDRLESFIINALPIWDLLVRSSSKKGTQESLLDSIEDDQLIKQFIENIDETGQPQFVNPKKFIKDTKTEILQAQQEELSKTKSKVRQIKIGLINSIIEKLKLLPKAEKVKEGKEEEEEEIHLAPPTRSQGSKK